MSSVKTNIFLHEQMLQFKYKDGKSYTVAQIQNAVGPHSQNVTTQSVSFFVLSARNFQETDIPHTQRCLSSILSIMCLYQVVCVCVKLLFIYNNTMTYDILQMTNLCLSTDTRNKTTAKKGIKTFTHVNIICSLHIKFCLTQNLVYCLHTN